jgi:sugar phosphate isomerase/epimerase
MHAQPSPTVSVSTGSFYVYPLNVAFRLIADAGYNAVELVIGPEVWLRGTGCVARLAKEHSLAILSVHPPILPFPGWMDVPATLPRLAETALNLEASLVCAHPPHVPSPDSAVLSRFVEAVRETLRLLEGTGTRLALENLAHYNRKDARLWLHNPEHLLALAEEVGVSLVLDTAHADSTSLAMYGVHALFHDRIANVHLSDVRRGGRRPGGRYLQPIIVNHQMPGNGRLPLDALLEDLLASGYTEPLTLELSPTALQIWSPRAARERLVEAREWVEAAVERALTPPGEE